MSPAPFSLRRRILLPLSVAGTILLLLFLTTFQTTVINQSRTEFARDLAGVRAYWKLELEHKALDIQSLVLTLGRDRQITDAILNHDRTALLQSLSPLYKALSRGYGIRNFTILDAQRRVIARIHDPADTATDLNGLPVVLEAQNSRAPAYGFDVCKRGYTLMRTVVPWTDNGQVVGYLLLGSDVAELLANIDQLFALRHIVVLDKGYLQQRKVSLLHPVNGTDPVRFDAYSDFVLLSSNLKAIPAPVEQALRDGQLASISEAVMVGHDDTTYFSSVLPINNNDGQRMGNIIILSDISEQLQAERRTVWVVGSSAVFLAVLLLWMLWRVTRQTDRVLDSSYQELQDSYRKIELAHKEWMESVDAIREPIFLHDAEYRVIRSNRAYAERAGMDYDAIIGKPYWEVFPRGDGPLNSCRHAMDSGEHFDSEEELRLDSGEVFLSRAFATTDEQGRYRYSVHILEDITERQRMLQALRRENRARNIISRSNKAVIHARDDNDLLETICNIITKQGGYQLAWVGYKEQGFNKAIRVVAAAGVKVEALRALSLQWDTDGDDDTAAALCLRTGRIVSVTDTQAADTSPRLKTATAGFQCHSVLDLPLINRGETFGVLGIGADKPNAFSQEESELLNELAQDLAYGLLALHSDENRERAEQERLTLMEKLETSLDKTVQAMATALEARDPYTAGHQRRVSELAVAIGEEMQLPREQVESLRIAGVLHDIGKIYVPAEILSKPGRLSPSQYELVKDHAQVSYDILKEIDFPWQIADMVHQHHERLDGSGYPQGLHGDQILPEARILAVADVVEAMGTHRPYRPALSVDAALEEITHHKKSWFDPKVVDACVRLFRERGYQLDDDH